ncbi:MAG: 4Fe-4S binding protein [Thermoplasmatales archaeon]|nr:MAG: 4Fe-4S binding protein [Thermoplasmatales archaeon]
MTSLQAAFDADKIEIPLGQVHIVRDRCKGCGYCIKYCPREVLEVSEKPNDKGYYFPRVKDEDTCLNCGLCELICPEFAIWSTLTRYVKPKLIKEMVNESF